ncbi:MAG: ureidoglycolate lyase [Rhodomicrobium sp.]
MQRALTLRPKALTREAFQPYGEVIQSEGAHSYKINRGATLRIHDLCKVHVKARGRVLVSFFEALETVSLPFRLGLLECHPLGSQAFIPRGHVPFLIVVAAPGDVPEAGRLQAFVSDGVQGVNYAPGVWHLPLASFELGNFLIIDRGGPGDNLREYDLSAEGIVVAN